MRIVLLSSSPGGWCCVLPFFFVEVLMGGAACHPPLWCPRCVVLQYLQWVVLFPSFLFWKWVLLGGAASPTSLSWRVVLLLHHVNWWSCFLSSCHGSASSSFGWCCFVDWPLGRPGDWTLWKVKDIGMSEPRASGVVGSWFVGSSIFDIVCSVAWALALSLSLTLSIVTFFWVVLLLPHSFGWCCLSLLFSCGCFLFLWVVLFR